MGRAHGRAAVFEAARALKEAGFGNVSFDLILRLPGQTPAGVRAALEEAVGLGPRQVVLYDLNVHEDTVFGRRAREGKLDLPSDGLHEAMFAAAEEILVGRAGFRHYEVSSFARPGYESRHNLIYWRNGEYLGLGPGAFSYMNGVRYQYARTVSSYLAKCEAGDPANDEEDHLTAEETEMETFLTGLRLEEGVDPSRFPRIRGHLENEIEVLEKQALMERYSGRVRLSARGKRLAESVFVRLSLPQKTAK
jgi:oxygen-independent coproporphyrinogen-3 oxidase